MFYKTLARYLERDSYVICGKYEGSIKFRAFLNLSGLLSSIL